ncbi:uncharacterized protein A4U43_C05F24480 [Asparagus officinalis]|uniref:Uncharacterized protein n=1 Tax=Asparagus officinalis TaxID=4686 RepID=A0A5P1EUC4_ASPOF|nr:uncharacterized protein A4U43_C05F24480 [Asparagus officinalis]
MRAKAAHRAVDIERVRGGANEGGPEERIGRGDLREDGQMVTGEGDVEVGEAAEELGDEEVAAVEAEAEEGGVGLLDLGEAAGGGDGGGEEGLESVKAAERGDGGGV